MFSQPEIGTVGLTEARARELCRKVAIYKTSFRGMRNTLGGRDERMMMKLVVDGESGRVVGCHILGPEASEMAQILAIALSGRDQGRFRRDGGDPSDRRRGARYLGRALGGD